MLHLQTKIKRQIELIGLACDTQRTPSIGDLANLYECEELTIKRDMGELRAHQGISIHSYGGNGVRIDIPLDNQQLRELIVQYLGICGANSNVDKATALLVRKHREKALNMVVVLQRSIEARKKVVIEYQKEADNLERDRRIAPQVIFQSEGSWRLLADHDGIIKQYHLNKIKRIRPTGESFVPLSATKITEMFRHSFRSWIGDEQHRVRLRLDRIWAQRIKPQLLVESQVIMTENDGSLVLEVLVNSLEEIASWVVSRGKGVTVLEPSGLRERVIELAKGALTNYD